jgi:4-hydroxy-3-methylbut-2-enyl diphosphate reductase
MKKFEVPIFYKSSIIQSVKLKREKEDPQKKDYSPSVLDFGPVQYLIARHFGFCYGVQNAIEISYRAIEDNPGKKIFLLSEMIHNPEVNKDLQERGVKFIIEPDGKQIISWNEINKNDIVIIPAFGTTVEIQKKLSEIDLETLKYDTTCPFVEKVWNRSNHLGKNGFTIIVHGKYFHEETRATFSHSKENAPTVIVRNLEETKILCDFILGEKNTADFFRIFNGRYSEGFNPEKNLQKIGVVNQTTMLASETQDIADTIHKTLEQKFGSQNLNEHFADTRDTLCYATHDNQRATLGLLEENASAAIVVGGYNSSNTSHIVELCEQKVKTYFISSAEKILSKDEIIHFDIHSKKEITSKNYLPEISPLRIILTSGASCPDAIVEEVMMKILSFFDGVKSIDEVLKENE